MAEATVRRVHTANGSYVDPPLDSAWPDLQKLRWHLAATLLDAGLPSDAMTVNQGRLTVGDREYPSYSLQRPAWMATVGDFHSAWSTINGVSYGAALRAQDQT